MAPTRREQERLLLDGAVTVDTVPALHQAGDALLGDGVSIIDFRGVTEVDSCAVALALQWLREAEAKGRPLAFANLPRAMHNLARLYGVSEFLPERS